MLLPWLLPTSGQPSAGVSAPQGPLEGRPASMVALVQGAASGLTPNPKYRIGSSDFFDDHLYLVSDYHTIKWRSFDLSSDMISDILEWISSIIYHLSSNITIYHLSSII